MSKQNEMPENIWAMTGSNYAEDGQVWWEGDKINDDDLEYIRKDKYDALKEKCEHQQKVIDHVHVVEKPTNADVREALKYFELLTEVIDNLYSESNHTSPKRWIRVKKTIKTALERMGAE